MGLHIALEGGGTPLTDACRHVLGMPHLCPSGLSENWLWKELGHRHWGLIAKAFGRAEAGFGPADEPPVYAAFRSISLQGGDLGGVRENDALDVRSKVTYLSETRVVSQHAAACRDRLVADVEMTSVFVRRQAEGVNRSIARVRIEGRGHAMPAFGGMPVQPSSTDHVFSGAVAAPDERELGTLVVEPCPHLDFNGAGLLYFSSFVAAVDRAEWCFLEGAQATTPPVFVELCSTRTSKWVTVFWCGCWLRATRRVAAIVRFCQRRMISYWRR